MANLTRKERLKLNLLKVGEIAKKAGVLRNTIDYYADIGLIKPDDYTQGKYRLFKENETLARIKKIRKLKKRGMILREIRKEVGA